MIVLDASAALALVTGRRPAVEAVAGRRLVAPHLVDIEVAHALRGLARGGKISAAGALRALGVWRALVLHRVAAPPFLDRVWELRGNLSAYDAVYVALAEALSVPLLTADAHLAGAAGPSCRFEVLPAA